LDEGRIVRPLLVVGGEWFLEPPTDEPDVDALLALTSKRLTEEPGNVKARLLRAKIAMPQGSDVTVINNAGALEDAVARFVAVLRPEAAHFTCHD
jgi:ribose 1,5-bisphosphokinase PhnN